MQGFLLLRIPHDLERGLYIIKKYRNISDSTGTPILSETADENQLI